MSLKRDKAVHYARLLDVQQQERDRATGQHEDPFDEALIDLADFLEDQERHTPVLERNHACHARRAA